MWIVEYLIKDGKKIARSKEIIMLLFLAGLLKEIFIANRFIERNFYC